jgi:hypothetical protein
MYPLSISGVCVKKSFQFGFKALYRLRACCVYVSNSYLLFDCGTKVESIKKKAQ